MAENQNMPLSDSDQEIFDILSEANRQYEAYLEINSPLAAIASLNTEIVEPERTIDHPLTITVTKER